MEKYFLAEYLRLSIEDGDVISDDSKGESNSIHHQRALLTHYRDENNLCPGLSVMEFVDDGYSGTNFERPAVKEMLSFVREGKIRCILVKDISRFGRNYLEVGDYLEQIFPFMGVRFIAVNDGYDSDDYIGTTGGIEVAFRSLLYDLYSKDLSVKMNSTLKIRRKRGDFIGPRAPFGYQFSANKKILAVDRVAAEYVRRIFELACEGYSTGKIAIKLNEENIPTPGEYKNQNGHHYHMLDGKGFWDRKKVLKILENEVYLGTVVNAKYRVRKVGAKKFDRVPDEERICVPGKHEAIVSEDTFRKASEIIRNSGSPRGTKHNFTNPGILQGKLKCGYCKKSLIRITCTTVPCFSCERAAYDKKSRCFRGRIKEPDIEKTLLEQINKKMIQGEKKPSAMQLKSDIRRLHNEIIDLEKKRGSLRTEKQYLYERFKMKQIEKKDYLECIETLRGKEERIEQKVQELLEKKEIYEKGIENDESMASADNLSRELVEAYIEAIYIEETGEAQIIWKK